MNAPGGSIHAGFGDAVYSVWLSFNLFVLGSFLTPTYRARLFIDW